MPSYDEARRIILEHVQVLRPETVPLLDAVGRVLASDVVMPCDMPRWDNSSMDGYAVRSADCAGPVTLRVTGFLPAGGLPTSPRRLSRRRLLPRRPPHRRSPTLPGT